MNITIEVALSLTSKVLRSQNYDCVAIRKGTSWTEDFDNLVSGQGTLQVSQYSRPGN
jgi:hypothetical protein